MIISLAILVNLLTLDIMNRVVLYHIGFYITIIATYLF